MATKNKYSDIDLSKYNQGYKASAVVNAAEAQKNAAENAVKNYGDFVYSNQDAYDNAMNAYLNRDEFKYDVNSDALYQQLRNQYVTQGQMAMMDTMGQAAGLTGGYGNSYATTAAYQAYQGQLQHLNDSIPELYRLTLDKYQADGDRLLNNFNMLSQDRATQYGEWGDRYNQLVADRGYYADNYNNVYDRDYGMWNDNRTYDTSQYWNEYNTGYQAERDRIADEQWQKQYNESVRQFNAELAEQQRQHNESLAEQQRQYNIKNSVVGVDDNSGGDLANALKGFGYIQDDGSAASAGGVNDDIKSKAASFSNNKDLAGYLDGLTSNGVITEAQADVLYAENMNEAQTKKLKDLVKSTNGWSVVDNGGVNWFWGVDNNAIVKAPNGESYRLDNLVDALVSEGVSKKEAKDLVKKLQGNLGA